MDFFSMFDSQWRVANVESDLQLQKSDADRLWRELQRGDRDLNKTMLAVEALVELLEERGILSRNEILERIREIDLLDGKQDGMMTPVAVECVNCHRPINPKLAKCLYCGAVKPPGNGVIR